MKIVYTEQAINSLEDALDFLAPKVSQKTLSEIRNRILNAADSLMQHPFKGQKEPNLKHLSLGHRRLIEGHYKIIYRISEEYIYITDVFDSRQDPNKMKG